MGEVEMNIRSMLTGELLRMVREDADDYTQEALQIALDELKQRNVSPQAAVPTRERSLDEVGQELPEDEETPSVAGPEDQFYTLLAEELQYEESYLALADFVESMNIRNGEYEAARFVVKKMDRENFILYTEAPESAERLISACIAVSATKLTGWMAQIAEDNGLQLEELEEEE